jgi:hypothetical protein
VSDELVDEDIVFEGLVGGAFVGRSWVESLSARTDISRGFFGQGYWD